jgi:hypothetical protein
MSQFFRDNFNKQLLTPLKPRGTFEPQIDIIHLLHHCNNISMFPSFRGKTKIAKDPRVKGDPRKKGFEVLLSDELKVFDRLQYLIDLDGRESFVDGTKMRYHLGDSYAPFE